MRILMKNVAYGKTYCDLWLKNHIPSILDETNLPEILKNHQVEYLLYTDQSSIAYLRTQQNFHRLSQVVKLNLISMDTSHGYDGRYVSLKDALQDSIRQALTVDAPLFVFVADLVVAKHYFTRLLKRLEEGYDSVFMLPPRGAAESIRLPDIGALDDVVLFDIVYKNMHPIWTHCHWDNPQFSKMPYTLIFNSYRGLLVRSLSYTPAVFKCNPEMVNATMIDRDLPGMCKRPFIAHDWTDAPMVGVEPLRCFYPTFANLPPSTEYIGSIWVHNLDKGQVPLLNHRLYYPNKKTYDLGLNPEQKKEQSNVVVGEILTAYKNSLDKCQTTN